jgi:hypothetical protein
MKTTLVRNLAALVAVTLFLSACSGAAAPDAAAIATSAVQTVEARYTLDAAQNPTMTETPVPTPADTPTLTPQASALPEPTATKQPLDSNGKPCYAAVFLADVTIPDGMLLAPGSAFTKTWRIQNNGNCAWDSTYSLMLASGDAMGAVTKIPLTTTVRPNESVDLSVDLTAPDTNGEYTGYWRIATPFGGTFGVGVNDQSLIVKIEVTDKPKRDVGASVTAFGLYSREPQTGCNPGNIAAKYTFSATITMNAPGAVTYHFNQYPFNGPPDEYKINFPEAGSKTVYWVLTMQHESLQGEQHPRAVSVEIDSPNSDVSERFPFVFTCSQ